MFNPAAALFYMFAGIAMYMVMLAQTKEEFIYKGIFLVLFFFMGWWTDHMLLKRFVKRIEELKNNPVLSRVTDEKGDYFEWDKETP